MPERATTQRAKRDLKRGRSASTAAGEFVREEMHHIREGKHGARSAKQAIAIGLSKARRAGVPLKVTGRASSRTRRSAARDLERGTHPTTPSPARSEAMKKALRKERHRAASHRALAAHATSAAGRRTRAARSASARKAARTKGPAARRAAAQKAARTRAKHA
jgi:hypothetical protein